VLAQREAVASLSRNGYKIVFERDGYVVLHRASPLPPRSSSPKVPA